MTVRQRIPPSIPLGHLPLKTEDRFEFSAARLNKKRMYRFCSGGGDQWHGGLPMLEGKMPEGDVSHRRPSIGGTKGAH